LLEQKLNVKISLRNDTSANWKTKNPILQNGELGIENDTRLVKVGDGTTNWINLKYINSATANNVAWDGITGKPSTYPPDNHNHDGSYPSTIGTRASGTWDINITGNASTASTATIANTVNGSITCQHGNEINFKDSTDDTMWLNYRNLGGTQISSILIGNGSGSGSGAYGTVIASNFIGNLTGNANTATTVSYPAGFQGRVNGSTWGFQGGTCLTDWQTASGGDISFMDNWPVNGELSVKLDGLFYQNEGRYACIDTSSIKDQSVSHADTAANATSDAHGNNIVNTYATKTELTSQIGDIETALKAIVG
jgi:hypothetical protein